MSILRSLNSRLASATGFEVRRADTVAPRPDDSVRRADDPPARQARTDVAYRPPADPESDRLLRRPVFLISPVRSGSTLLRLVLNAHPRLHSPHELHVRRLEVCCGTRLAERSMAALGLDRGGLEHLLWDRVMHRELVRSGKEILVEKTPGNAFAYRRLAAGWPDARFVFLLRHPASIARSWHEADPEKRPEEEAALDALRYLRATERARQRLSGHTVRCEDLTADPEETLRGICAFLDLPYDPGMLDYGPQDDGDLQKGLGDWKEKIRTGRVQAGRELPAPQNVPEPLREIAAAWGYLGDGTPAGTGGAHAEIAEVWPREGRIRLVGRLHGTDAAGSWELVLTRRGTPEHLTYLAPLDGGRFDVGFPATDLLRDGRTDALDKEPALWDIHLAGVGGGVGRAEARLRAGRHLDSLKGKKNIMVFPALPVSGPGQDVRVQPYYTVKDNLSVECWTDRTPSDVRAAP